MCFTVILLLCMIRNISTLIWLIEHIVFLYFSVRFRAPVKLWIHHGPFMWIEYDEPYIWMHSSTSREWCAFHLLLLPLSMEELLLSEIKLDYWEARQKMSFFCTALIFIFCCTIPTCHSAVPLLTNEAFCILLSLFLAHFLAKLSHVSTPANIFHFELSGYHFTISESCLWKAIYHFFLYLCFYRYHVLFSAMMCSFSPFGVHIFSYCSSALGMKIYHLLT